MKTRPVCAGLLHPGGRTDERTDRPTDMAKLIVAFRKFTNAPKNKGHLIKTSAISQSHLCGLLGELLIMLSNGKRDLIR